VTAKTIIRLKRNKNELIGERVQIGDEMKANHKLKKGIKAKHRFRPDQKKKTLETEYLGREEAPA